MTALCRHFGTCGGCAFQDLSADAYRTMKQETVRKVLALNGVHAPVASLLETASATRRRAALRAVNMSGELHIGFNAQRSHAVVDMQECFVLTPALVSLVQELRNLLRRFLPAGEQAEIAATETDSGFDLSLSLSGKGFLRHTALLAQWARAHHVARLSVNGEVGVQLVNPAIRIGTADLVLPQATFLQPSREGERILQASVSDVLRGARRIVDLFAGCGTFSLILAQRAAIHAVDLDTKGLKSLGEAARKTSALKPVSTEIRDLFKNPLRQEELNRFEAVVIDPPRAGARAQAQQIVQSRIGRLAYVSCNPETFGRDAAILTQGGFHLTGVNPVDQFHWSKHIELVGAFERKPGWSQRRKD